MKWIYTLPAVAWVGCAIVVGYQAYKIAVLPPKDWSGWLLVAVFAGIAVGSVFAARSEWRQARTAAKHGRSYYHPVQAQAFGPKSGNRFPLNTMQIAYARKVMDALLAAGLMRIDERDCEDLFFDYLENRTDAAQRLPKWDAATVVALLFEHWQDHDLDGRHMLMVERDAFKQMSRADILKAAQRMTQDADQELCVAVNKAICVVAWLSRGQRERLHRDLNGDTSLTFAPLGT